MGKDGHTVDRVWRGLGVFVEWDEAGARQGGGEQGVERTVQGMWDDLIKLSNERDRRACVSIGKEC
ncbi:hypothetical protein E2C01_081020 [Portunus trituberculatus]|uniref:Uncharacterized protein n=1 Tax=Portunus trituberculatus TaxID=210409 RepID=A0A5B7IQV3_PORTR|nr:hypothetical protein [Portunus trituberculatus]